MHAAPMSLLLRALAWLSNLILYVNVLRHVFVTNSRSSLQLQIRAISNTALTPSAEEPMLLLKLPLLSTSHMLRALSSMMVGAAQAPIVAPCNHRLR